MQYIVYQEIPDFSRFHLREGRTVRLLVGRITKGIISYMPVEELKDFFLIPLPYTQIQTGQAREDPPTHRPTKRTLWPGSLVLSDCQ